MEQIEHRVRSAYIDTGHPATLPLWYPPRNLMLPEYIWELEHLEFSNLSISDHQPEISEQQEPLPANLHHQRFCENIRNLIILLCITILYYVI